MVPTLICAFYSGSIFGQFKTQNFRDIISWFRDITHGLVWGEGVLGGCRGDPWRTAPDILAIGSLAYLYSLFAPEILSRMPTNQQHKHRHTRTNTHAHMYICTRIHNTDTHTHPQHSTHSPIVLEKALCVAKCNK